MARGLKGPEPDSAFSSARCLLGKSPSNRFIVVAALTLLAPCAAQAEARLVIEADSGKVLEAENATMPWYPASVTKMMTAYVTLKAIKDGKITLDTLFTVVAGCLIAVAGRRWVSSPARRSPSTNCAEE